MKKIIKIHVVLSILTIFAAHASAESKFPKGPQLEITSGKICDIPISYRYPENIAYCDRDVSFETKGTIIDEYDQRFGYSITDLPRSDFKIDHLVPLCAGGSNDIVNLWPQHKSVYAITDPLEPLVCQKMAKGRLKQSEAVRLIIEAKTDLTRTKAIIKYIKTL